MERFFSLPDAIQHLQKKGYRLADSNVASMSDDAIQSEDWRLDSVHQIKQNPSSQMKALVIAVSSMRKQMKLVFVEVLMPKSDFTPLTLLKRLFPRKK